MDDGLPVRPSADETEEDLLEMQRQFLADRQSGSAADRPAAAAVRVQPPQRPREEGGGGATATAVAPEPVAPPPYDVSGSRGEWPGSSSATGADGNARADAPDVDPDAEFGAPGFQRTDLATVMTGVLERRGGGGGGAPAGPAPPVPRAELFGLAAQMPKTPMARSAPKKRTSLFARRFDAMVNPLPLYPPPPPPFPCSYTDH